MLHWKFLILLCLVTAVKCKRDNHIKRVAGKAMSKRQFIQLCCGVKPCKNSTTPHLVSNANLSWTQNTKPSNAKILTAESTKKTSSTTRQAKKTIKATSSPLVSSVSTQKTESTTSNTLPATSSSTTETIGTTSTVDPVAAVYKEFKYQYEEETTTPLCLPPQCTTQLTSPLPLPSCPSKCETDDYSVNLAQKMNESMEGLQVDLFSSPGTPTFFKACNRTYFLVSKMLTWEEAYAECCSYGYQPVSFQKH